MSDVMRTGINAAVNAFTQPYMESRALASLLTNVGQVYTTTVTGTGADLNVTTPGDPKFAIVVNTNTGCVALKINGMAGAYASKFKASDNSQSYADALVTLGTNKLTVGTDADLNTAVTLVVLAVI